MSLHHAAKSKQMYLYTSNCTTHASDSMGPIVATGDVGIKKKKTIPAKLVSVLMIVSVKVH